ncbi:hypothetical protein OZX72_06780 [Bifidobacterium sp. ESL0769]|uniref:hypothetical protein n=1 Tax=Bifidobacterium sp. ESL0769 TaxID=2983229 RepID=UPI0023F81BDF|nr:hypothetical protein [Bifidobacterium sp. ESL0769]WEV66951.1 hypothetical protein OZX72_06780 [Bifidobacterium sp. ESL0769]
MTKQGYADQGSDRQDGNRPVYRRKDAVPVVPSRAKGCLIAIGVLNVCAAIFLSAAMVMAGTSTFRPVEMVSLGAAALVCLVVGVVTLVFVGVRSASLREAVRWSCRVGIALLAVAAVVDVVLRSSSEYIAVCFFALFMGAFLVDGVLHFLDFVGLKS